MKLNKTLTALAVSASFGLSGQAFAAGTPSGTSITNTLNLSYTVDNQTQTPVVNTETFVVDTKVDFTLTLQSADSQDVTPGKDYTATYLLTNLSNATIDFNLSAGNLAGTDIVVGLPSNGNTVNDNAELDAVSVRVEADGEYDSTGTAPTSSFDSATDIATSITDLQADYAQVVYVFVTADDAATDTQIAAANLTAVAADAGTPLSTDLSANVQNGTPQIVLADNLFDGTETINSAFEIVSARFTHDVAGSDIPGPGLTFKVINDTICDPSLTATTTKVDYSSAGCTINVGSPAVATTYFPKALPGAMIEYTIVAKNTGGAPATNVTFLQNLLSAHVDAINLQADSLKNVTPAYNDVAPNTLGNAVITNTLDDNLLTVNVDNFEEGEDITITFTAIVE